MFQRGRLGRSGRGFVGVEEEEGRRVEKEVWGWRRGGRKGVVEEVIGEIVENVGMTIAKFERLLSMNLTAYCLVFSGQLA